ncbi:uncharacterized protein [Drosophila takahashii]|uniref:uncharacterized protein n=1 Tax=Drosophila takahashii TaxID=29030 RepID=UPI003898FE08
MSLSCSAKKCEFNGVIAGETYLLCWLCENTAHCKCAGVGVHGRIGDLISKRIGFLWTCSACREITDEMRSFMRQTRTGFREIKKLFSHLHEKLIAVESQFNGLKIIKETPTKLSSPPTGQLMNHLTPTIPPSSMRDPGSSNSSLMYASLVSANASENDKHYVSSNNLVPPLPGPLLLCPTIESAMSPTRLAILAPVLNFVTPNSVGILR